MTEGRRSLGTRWVAIAALGGLLTVAVAVVGIGRWIGAPQEVQGVAAEPVDALTSALDRALRRPAQGVPGVAIRPLTAGDGNSTVWVDSMCDALAQQLARLPDLRVVPCTATRLAVAVPMDDARLARLLVVPYVLRGEIAPLADERVQVRLALHEAKTQRTVWRIDETIAPGDMQLLPARVTAATGRALGIADAAPPPPPIDAQAYASFARARELSRRPSLDDRRAALRLLDEVLAVEPGHVDSRMTRNHLQGYLLGNDGRGQDLAALKAAREANVAEGLALAREITAADPLDLRGQWLLLGNEIEQRQWVAGMRRLDGMLQRQPRHGGLLRLAARLHLHTGYVARAHELALAAAQVNALDAEAFEILALSAGILQRDVEMREFIAIARQLGHQGLGRVEVFDAYRRRDWAELERAHTAWVGWGGQWSTEWVAGWARGVADASQREVAARALDALDMTVKQHFVSHFVELALLGDAERSLRAVQRHAKMPPATWMQHLWWPELAAVRQAPGFAPAMQDWGATALWSERGAPDFCARVADGAWACR